MPPPGTTLAVAFTARLSERLWLFPPQENTVREMQSTRIRRVIDGRYMTVFQDANIVQWKQACPTRAFAIMGKPMSTAPENMDLDTIRERAFAPTSALL